MKKNNKEEYLIISLLVIPVLYFALKIAPFMDKGLINAIYHLNDISADPFSITWCTYSLKTVFLFLMIYVFGIMIYISTIKNYRRQEEYGSAKWANVTQVNNKYCEKDFFANKILSQNVRIGLNGKKHRRNINTIVIGGSGAGKTRFYGKPNIMQCNTSFVVLDPKGGAIRSRMKSTCAQLNK